MGKIITIDHQTIEWITPSWGEPPEGYYIWRGHNKSGGEVYQNKDDPNIVCLRISSDLIIVDYALLSHVGLSKPGGGSNYGLTQNPNNLYAYNTETSKITTLRENGRNVKSSIFQSSSPTASLESTFNIPNYIEKDGQKYYPRENRFCTGNVHYYLIEPPSRSIDIAILSNLHTYLKEQSVSLTPQSVLTYSEQARVPDQSVVMGAATWRAEPLSARTHVMQVFSVDVAPRSWHWCHLVAHSMRPNKEGQVAENLVAGTAGVNGAMLALEKAVKQILSGDKAYKKIDYEATAEVFSGTHIAKLIRVRISDSYKWSCTFYFEATIAERDVTIQTEEYKNIIRKEIMSYEKVHTPKNNHAMEIE